MLNFMSTPKPMLKSKSKPKHYPKPTVGNLRSLALRISGQLKTLSTQETEPCPPSWGSSARLEADTMAHLP